MFSGCNFHTVVIKGQIVLLVEIYQILKKVKYRTLSGISVI